MRRVHANASAICGMLVVMWVCGLHATVDARDDSGVLKASDLIGTKVEGADGKTLGSIKDLIIDPTDGHKRLALDLHKKDLKDAPGFNKSHGPDLIEQQAVIYEFYEVPPPSEDHTAFSVQ